MRRFRVAALQDLGTELRLGAEASHHLLVVCRHPRGHPVLLFDGQAQQTATLTGVDEGIAVVTVTSPRTATDPRPSTHLVLGIPKGPALEHALRMATELGVTHIHPAMARRSVSRSDRSDRWRRVVDSACQQCGRVDVPTLYPLCPLTEALARVPTEVLRYLGTPNAPGLTAAHGATALAVGPEGGFDATEEAHMVQAGWQPAGFGTLVLRTDTAVAVGLGILRS